MVYDCVLFHLFQDGFGVASAAEQRRWRPALRVSDGRTVCVRSASGSGRSTGAAAGALPERAPATRAQCR